MESREGDEAKSGGMQVLVSRCGDGDVDDVREGDGGGFGEEGKEERKRRTAS
jgi:hypothetical protein